MPRDPAVCVVVGGALSHEPRRPAHLPPAVRPPPAVRVLLRGAYRVTFTPAELATLARIADHTPSGSGEAFTVECADHMRRVHPHLDDTTLAQITLCNASLAALVHAAGWDGHDRPLAEFAGVLSRIAVHLASLELETGNGAPL